MSSSEQQSDIPSIPPPLLLSDPEGADAARQRLAPKSRLGHLFSKTKPRSSLSVQATRTHQSNDSATELPASAGQAPILEVTDVEVPITLDSSALSGEDLDQDRYEWAVLYENQRGMTVFSTPYYSSLSLLPTDPSPFTLPDTSLKRSKQPPVTLDSYPLPDGNWRWVSRCWMIDMRSDTGQVQHDGFEYNWIFRTHKWRAHVGHFTAGGFVRRRRWVRLMVRPARPRQENGEIRTPLSATPGSSVFHVPPPHRGLRQSLVSTLPPSVATGRTDLSNNSSHVNPDDVWMGDVESDWGRCRRLMNHFGRDGRKLELWRLWLGFYHPEHKEKFLDPEDAKGKRREKQWTEDEAPLPSELAANELLLSKETVSVAPKEHVIAVLRKHGTHMLQLFVFPESRAQFLKLLGQARLLPELNMSLDFGMSEIDFWSYASGLGNLAGSEEILKATQSIDLLGVKGMDGDGSRSLASVATV